MLSVQELKEKLYEIQNTNISTFTILPEEEPRFVINADERTIAIPEQFKFLSVQYDHRAETVYFEIDRYFDDEDLSKHTCVVQYINNDGKGTSEGIYAVKTMDVNTIDNKIIFEWTILADATQLAGTIMFAVRFYSMNEDGVFTYNFNTLPAESSILESINVDEPTFGNIYAPEVQEWFNKINQAATNANDAVDKAQKIKEETQTIKDSVITETNKIKDNAQTIVDDAIKSFGKFADFYIEDNVLCANTINEYGVENMNVDDEGMLHISIEINEQEVG